MYRSIFLYPITAAFIVEELSFNSINYSNVYYSGSGGSGDFSYSHSGSGGGYDDWSATNLPRTPTNPLDKINNQDDHTGYTPISVPELTDYTCQSFNPCGNRGECRTARPTSIYEASEPYSYCVCFQDYKHNSTSSVEMFCQEKINDCNSSFNTCVYRQKCLDLTRVLFGEPAFQCLNECEDGYMFESGKCKKISACDMNSYKCEHGTKCVNLEDIYGTGTEGYACGQISLDEQGEKSVICPSFWTGQHCEQDIDECSSSIQICGEHGLCENNDNGGYSCSCKDGYRGSNCSQKPQTYIYLSWIQTFQGSFNSVEISLADMVKEALIMSAEKMHSEVVIEKCVENRSDELSNTVLVACEIRVPVEESIRQRSRLRRQLDTSFNVNQTIEALLGDAETILSVSSVLDEAGVNLTGSERNVLDKFEDAGDGCLSAEMNCDLQTIFWDRICCDAVYENLLLAKISLKNPFLISLYLPGFFQRNRCLRIQLSMPTRLHRSILYRIYPNLQT